MRRGSTRNTSMITAVLLLVSSALVAGDGRKCAEITSASAEKDLAAIFDQYCTDVGNNPSHCRPPWSSSVSVGRRWLAVENWCTESKGAPCTTFDCPAIQALQPPVLAYDHLTGRWVTDKRLNTDVANKVSIFETDFSGVPTARLAVGDQLEVVVRNTNPLLYTLTPGEATEEEAAWVSELASLASLLGGGVTARVQAMKALAEVPREHQPLTVLETQVLKLGLELDKLAREQQEGAALVELVELARLKGNRFDVAEACKEPPGAELIDLAALDKLFEQLREAIEEVEKQSKACVTSELRTLVEFLDVAAKDPDQIPAAHVLYLVAHSKTLCRPPDACNSDRKEAFRVAEAVANKAEVFGTEADKVTKQQNAVQSLEQRHAKYPKDPEINAQLATAREELNKAEKARDQAKEALDGQIESGKKFRGLLIEAERDTALLQTGRDLLAGRAKAAKARAQLMLLSQRLADACSSGAFETALYLDRDHAKTKWNKVVTYSLEISPDSAFADHVQAAQPAKVTTKYRVGWRRDPLFGVGVGVTYTELSSPTWSAVAPSEGAPKEITKTGEDSRAGTLALFANYRFLQHLEPRTGRCFVKPGVEVGAALDASKPALFLGLTFEFGKYVRLGWGHTWQQVKVLDGQEEKSPIAATEDIRTRNAFRGDWYASLTLALDSLKLFAPAKE